MIVHGQMLLLLIFLATRSFASNLTDDSIDLCSNDEVNYNEYTTLNFEGCGCDICVRRCCRSGFQYYHAGNSVDGELISGCKKGESTNFSVQLYDTDKKVQDLYDGFSIGILDCINQEVVEFNMEQSSIKYFYVQQNGSLYYPHDKEIDNMTDYCVSEKNGRTTYYFCKDLVDKTLLIHVAAKIIPVPFLLATFLVYVILPERTIHRKALIFHTLCLIPGNILLAVSQYYVIEHDVTCIGSGYVILYCLSSSYFWMNIMCIDIWLAFRGVRGFGGSMSRENVLFIILSIYAWGTPGLILLVVALLDAFGDKNKDYWPGIGQDSCFLRDLPSLLYYFGPTITLIVFNSILFILTTINIQRSKRDAAVLERAGSGKHTNRDDEKFTLYWNLLFVMGINPIVSSHLIQLISWTVGWLAHPSFAIYFIYYKDFAHAMYGIVIFIIFVCKKRIRKELIRRYRQFAGKVKDTESSTSTTISIKSPSEVIAMSDVRLTNFKTK